jgi:tripeptidyl-peptidase-1
LTARVFLAVDGAFIGITGTSASTPTIASIITMINDARITNGKNPLGFLNPMVCFVFSLSIS